MELNSIVILIMGTLIYFIFRTLAEKSGNFKEVVFSEGEQPCFYTDWTTYPLLRD